MTAQELYDESVRMLPTAERLRLVELIFRDVDPRLLLGYSSEWSDEDMRDFARASRDYAIRSEEADDSR